MNRDPLILQSTAVMVGLLVLAQLVVATLAWRKPSYDFHEIRVRIRSWWFILLSLEGFLFLGKLAALFYFASISFFALREYLSRVPTRMSDRKVLLWVFLAIPFQFFLIYREWLMLSLCFIPIYSLSVVAVRLLLTGHPRGFVTALSTFQLGLMGAVYSVANIAYLTLLRGPEHYTVTVGPVLFLICVTQLNDVFQFISGKTLGKTKIMPLISPKKTVEGFMGGVILSSLLAFTIAPWLTPFNRLEGLVAGSCLAVFGFFGDVLMSAIKRDLGIKDFSQIIPGHGGVLDRMDSLVISAPLFFQLLRMALERASG